MGRESSSAVAAQWDRLVVTKRIKKTSKLSMNLTDPVKTRSSVSPFSFAPVVPIFHRPQN